MAQPLGIETSSKNLENYLRQLENKVIVFNVCTRPLPTNSFESGDLLKGENAEAIGADFLKTERERAAKGALLMKSVYSNGITPTRLGEIPTGTEFPKFKDIEEVKNAKLSELPLLFNDIYFKEGDLVY